MSKIFVNYRRGDAADSTGWLYDRLQTEFPSHNLFMDVEGHIGPGDDFVDVIGKKVQQCDVLLAVIGPRWLELLEARTGDAEDFVVLEIQTALEQGKRVIPVLVGGATIPPRERLPEPIRALARRNAIELRSARFKADSDVLIKALQSALGRPASGAETIAPAASAPSAAARADGAPDDETSWSWKLLVLGVPFAALAGFLAVWTGFQLRTTWLFDEIYSGVAVAAALLLAATLYIAGNRRRLLRDDEMLFAAAGGTLWALLCIPAFAQSIACYVFGLCADRLCIMSDSCSTYDSWPSYIARLLVALTASVVMARVVSPRLRGTAGLAHAVGWFAGFVLFERLVSSVRGMARAWDFSFNLPLSLIALFVGLVIIATQWRRMARPAALILSAGLVFFSWQAYISLPTPNPVETDAPAEPPASPAAETAPKD